MSPVLERPDASQGGARSGPRPLDQIFPQHGDVLRGPLMQGTWLAFCAEMDGAVQAALDSGRSPPEIAYAIGEIVHNYFRTRGVTLTSYELRRLVIELLALHGGARRGPVEPAASSSSSTELVSFAGEPAMPETPWTGDEPGTPGPVVPEAVFEAPPSTLVSLALTFDDLLARVLAVTRSRLAVAPERRVDRDEALQAIDAAIAEVLRGAVAALQPTAREHLKSAALSEICGLGLIDRLWADRSIRAVFVNGPKAVHVERNGVLEPSPETFRDHAHLLELAGRLVRRPPTAVAQFQLRDGGSGTVIFPPAAPAGPVLVIRRGEPGTATFEWLIASQMLDRPIADLLRIAARSRLNVLIAGPEGSGKTALLVAIARDLDGVVPVVTLARHREFRWASSSKVELVASSGAVGSASYPMLMAAGAHLQPHLLVFDSLQREDVPALAERLSRGERGSVVAVGPNAIATSLERSVDLVVRLARGRDGPCRVVSMEDAGGAVIFVHENGRFHRRTVEPAFAATVRNAGYGEALSSVLR